MAIPLPIWAKDLIASYASHSSNQFILHGNVNDRFVVPENRVGSLDDYLFNVILPKFDLILTYDLGDGLRAARGGSVKGIDFQSFVGMKAPRLAIEKITQTLREIAILRKVSREKQSPMTRVAVIIKGAHLVAPCIANSSTNYELSSIVCSIRNWAIETQIVDHDIATFLVADNLNDLHPLLVNNNRTTKIQIPFPTKDDINTLLMVEQAKYFKALRSYSGTESLAGELVGLKLGTVESLLTMKQYKDEAIQPSDLVSLKKQLVESDANGLLQFMECKRTLDDFTQNDAVRDHIRKDMNLWRQGDIQALPMGYGFFAPVGTGKNYLVECIAGEAGVPVVTIGNFRDKYVGNTESNVERIFRFIDALSRCIVFIDEADQTMGKRDSGNSDGGLGGRVYSMWATKMSNPLNRGRILWAQATSRPDLLEIDLKRPGRMDTKFPLLPCINEIDGFPLLNAICRKKGVELPSDAFESLKSLIPQFLTAGAAESLAVKAYRTMKTEKKSPLESVVEAFDGYQPPVPFATLEFQIKLAIAEASDLDFVPKWYRDRYTVKA
jgi:hypothetical protein